MSEASIVFRNQDLSATAPVYVDTLQSAAELAAKYRNASKYVDIINRQDEVALRFENGAPDWQLGQPKPMKLDTPEYDFGQRRDLYAKGESCLRLLSETIPFAFDTAVGQASDYTFEWLIEQTEHHGGDDVWGLIREARIAAKAADKTKSSNAWAMELVRWMKDSNRLFVRYRVEYAALVIKLPEVHLDDRVSQLGMELAELEAHRDFR